MNPSRRQSRGARARLRGAALASSLCFVALSVCRTPPARAQFDDSEVGARALGLGHSFVSVADDASAVHWNPAGLTILPRHEILLSYDEAADLEGVRHGFGAVALHRGMTSAGSGWRHGELESTASEDVFYWSVARTLTRRSLGAFAAAGATLKAVRRTTGDANGPGRSATRWTADAGILLTPIPNVTTGVAARNFGQPGFPLGARPACLEFEVEWGLSLRWREDAWMHVSRLQGDRISATRAAVEYRIANAIGVRAGLGRRTVAGGFGIDWGTWRFDAAFRARDPQGWTYRLGLRRGFGAQRDAPGGDFDAF